MQTSATVDADIRIGRRRHPQRSMQTSATVDADIRNGRRGCFTQRLNIKVAARLTSRRPYRFH
ncbi:hypothetical protein [Leyella stercorea]|uniref:hypothetical protein n=1 Tax=Leyella stercorea TaxID=363265 RepID=UPI00266BFDC3|nr:hypothetical protein [Leyella stercorea]